MSLLDSEVTAFNEGVRTGDWSSLVELFDGAIARLRILYETFT